MKDQFCEIEGAVLLPYSCTLYKTKDGKIIITVSIPPNTTTTIKLPAAVIETITESGAAVSTVFKNIKQDGNNVLIETGSGNYVFEYPVK